MVGVERVDPERAVARITILQVPGPSQEKPEVAPRLRGVDERAVGSRGPSSSSGSSVVSNLDTGGGAKGEEASEFVRADTVRALSQIGAEVELLPASDVRQCVALAGRFDIDLVVLDRCKPATVASVFESEIVPGTPVVVVIAEDASESEALDAFRHGAADCVRVGSDYSEVLALVAMEQIRRWRQLRDREASRSKIQWLENLNEAIVSEIPVALAVLDEARCVVEINPEFERNFGLSRENVRGVHIQTILPTELIESCDLMQLIPPPGLALPEGSRLARMAEPGGGESVFDVRSRRLDTDGHILLALSNVTKTEFLSRRLGELERFNNHVVQSINSALIVIDMDGTISFANPTAGQILGHSEAELKGQPVDRFFPPTREAPSPLNRVLQDGIRSKGGEMMLSRANGAAVPIGMSCTPFLGEEGRIQGAVAIFQDLSEIKELQRQVLQQEKMASIGQLAAGIAHEINNPVGFIHANLAQMGEYLDELSGYLDATSDLNQAVRSGDTREIDRAVGALEEQGSKIEIDYLRKDFASALRESLEGSERIRHIVSDLRDFSHQGGLATTLADVNQCVDSTANIVWTMMKHSVELKKDYHDLPELRCHPMQLKQVFMNLLVNAYHAIEENFDDASEAAGVIEISTRVRDEGIEVRVRDTGAGIAEENLQRIFDPFFTTKEVGAGTGLGLSTSYGIVKKHGGEMTVTSEAGRGACFEVFLPLTLVSQADDTDAPSEP